jgi:hypothetical protein
MKKSYTVHLRQRDLEALAHVRHVAGVEGQEALIKYCIHLVAKLPPEVARGQGLGEFFASIGGEGGGDVLQRVDVLTCESPVFAEEANASVLSP